MGEVIYRINLQNEFIIKKIEAEKLDELNKQKSLFVSIVSHELKTPLTSIKLFTELMMQNENLAADKKVKYLKVIEGESDRLTKLINNVLDYSKIEKNIKNYNKSKLKLSQIIRSTVADLEYLLDKESISLHLDLHENNDYILGDEDALKGAIINIISNAIKYSTNKREIIIKSIKNENCVSFSVQDYGVGMVNHEIENLFMPFYRANNNQTVGTGLGLVIVKHAVDAHNGTITIESLRNYGTTVTISIPKINTESYESESIVN
jgi:signal transduction histidine kinase